jgi:anti-anti-sigma regulatory factor
MIISQEPVTSSTTILQPESLHGLSGQTFQQTLEQALSHASAVIVDLLWVGTVDSDGINLLAQSMIRSQASGKDITFLGLEHNAKLELEHRIKSSSSSNSTLGHGIFAPDFEAFLDRHRDLKASEALI